MPQISARIPISTSSPSSLSSPQNLLDYAVEEIVDMALCALRKTGSHPIEWGALLDCRMHIPRVVKNFSYIVGDEELESASALLEVVGLPLMPSTRFNLNTGGDFRVKGRFHRITNSTDPASIQHLILYPRTFIPLLPDELEEVSAIHTTSPIFSPRILAPKRPAAYAIHIRMLLAYPNLCRTRTILAASLEQLIRYDLLGMEDGCCPNIEDEDEYWDARYPELAAKAIATLRQWKFEGAWADGEDWIGDALAAVINGTGSMEHLSLAKYG